MRHARVAGRMMRRTHRTKVSDPLRYLTPDERALLEAIGRGRLAMSSLDTREQMAIPALFAGGFVVTDHGVLEVVWFRVR